MRAWFLALAVGIAIAIAVWPWLLEYWSQGAFSGLICIDPPPSTVSARFRIVWDLEWPQFVLYWVAMFAPIALTFRKGWNDPHFAEAVAIRFPLAAIFGGMVAVAVVLAVGREVVVVACLLVIVLHLRRLILEPCRLTCIPQLAGIALFCGLATIATAEAWEALFGQRPMHALPYSSLANEPIALLCAAGAAGFVHFWVTLADRGPNFCMARFLLLAAGVCTVQLVACGLALVRNQILEGSLELTSMGLSVCMGVSLALWIALAFAIGQAAPPLPSPGTSAKLE